MALTLGSIGEEMDLLIRQGATFGPHVVTMTNPDGSPVDLTGVLLRGSIRKEPRALVKYDLTFVITNPTGGVYKMFMLDTETKVLTAGPSLSHVDSRYVWDSEMVDTLGNVIPLYYGKVNVQREITRE